MLNRAATVFLRVLLHSSYPVSNIHCVTIFKANKNKETASPCRATMHRSSTNFRTPRLFTRLNSPKKGLVPKDMNLGRRLGGF